MSSIARGWQSKETSHKVELIAGVQRKTIQVTVEQQNIRSPLPTYKTEGFGACRH